MEEVTASPDLSALAGKIKLVLSSFPHGDVQEPSKSQRERALSDFEQPETTFILGEIENCQPTVVVPQQDLCEDDSHSDSSSSSGEDSITVAVRTDEKPQEGIPMQLIPASKLPVDTQQAIPETNMPIEAFSSPIKPKETQKTLISETSPSPPKHPDELSFSTKPVEQPSPPSSTQVPKLAPAITSQSRGPMMVISSHSPNREPATKVPIMVTRSEDVNQMREELAKTHASAPDHKERRACNGCYLS
jgi:hypothetical protein